MRHGVKACALALASVLAAGWAPARSAQEEFPLLGDKTLVVWAAPADLTKKAASTPLSLDNLGGNFDAIIFGELSPGKWMAGSDWFKRTDRNQEDWPLETGPTGTVVQIAVTYRARTPTNQTITLYRDGERYAQYEAGGEPLTFGVGGIVCIGLHVFNLGATHFAGTMDDVRIYDVPLSAEEIRALQPDRASKPEPWAWWNFEGQEIKDVTGRFETLVFGDPVLRDGVLELDGEDDAVIGMRGAAEAGMPVKPPAPQTYAYVYSAGYGQANFFPTNLVEFEQLIVNMREGGFNTIHCTYRPEYVEICRKHGMRIMLDILAWLPPVEQDVRRPRQQATVLDICRKVRGDDTIWGYNLWNERFDRFAPGGFGTLNGLVLLLRKWDPTHPIWAGTYMTWFPDALVFEPGCIAYYDYHWERGMKWHFNNLNGYYRFCEQRDTYFGRWMRNHDYPRSAYTMNTSIVFGLKTGMWFICGPWHPADPHWKKDDVLCRIGRDHQRLWPEIGRIGRPLQIYSTLTTRTADNREKSPSRPRGIAVPEDFPLQFRNGEVLIGHFRYPDGTDALYVANQNAFLAQPMRIERQGNRALQLEMFDRGTGDWKALLNGDGVAQFELAGGGGELLRVTGARLPQQE